MHIFVTRIFFWNQFGYTPASIKQTNATLYYVQPDNFDMKWIHQFITCVHGPHLCDCSLHTSELLHGIEHTQRMWHLCAHMVTAATQNEHIIHNWTIVAWYMFSSYRFRKPIVMIYTTLTPQTAFLCWVCLRDVLWYTIRWGTVQNWLVRQSCLQDYPSESI